MGKFLSGEGRQISGAPGRPALPLNNEVKEDLEDQGEGQVLGVGDDGANLWEFFLKMKLSRSSKV